MERCDILQRPGLSPCTLRTRGAARPSPGTLCLSQRQSAAVHCLHRASSPRRSPSSLCAASRPAPPSVCFLLTPHLLPAPPPSTSSQHLLPEPPPSTSSLCLLLLKPLLLLLTPLLLLPESGIDSVEEE
ncbi:unnamed protein product [Arctogadus glacialis]